MDSAFLRRNGFRGRPDDGSTLSTLETFACPASLPAPLTIDARPAVRD
ncbi:hypothetical protein [Natrinema sp. 1APR25-10V2]|nr:hypothetical protein [Natrinema sp. 1APR25-10V2]MDS0476683.1 hypothetical protein [Natrinema sp. 1APR25-10V2]